MKTQEDEVAEIERELKQQEIEDLKRYEESTKDERRKSLAYRLDKAHKDKDFDEGQKALQGFIEKEELRLREQDRADVATYRKALQEARRKSLEYRNQSEVTCLITVLLLMKYYGIRLFSYFCLLHLFYFNRLKISSKSVCV